MEVKDTVEIVLEFELIPGKAPSSLWSDSWEELHA